ncbi:hypothetical protein F2Q69_00047374 [Brassica cretica]|uniref:Uncharacterized protein n=1 Tax=Brassica cretica TaxID=69181 RepID=A0A8S9Q3D0_BRACR|nr:hypothetical protein F2Q69_00047374 [Brassica cretica]
MNSATSMELEIGSNRPLEIGSNRPPSLYISRMKAIQEVDFPSLYIQSSCSGTASNSSKEDPHFSTSTSTSGRSRPYHFTTSQRKN